MPALAMTDLANVFGMVKFYNAARRRGVKPIIGCDVWINNELERDKASACCCLCNRPRATCGCARCCPAPGSRTSTAGAPRSSGRGSRIRVRHRCNGYRRADCAVRRCVRRRRHRPCTGQHRPGRAACAGMVEAVSGALLHRAAARRRASDRKHHPRAVTLAGRLALPVVATHPVQFLRPEEFIAHEARVCIAEGYVLADQRRPRVFTPESYFKTQAEMAELFADLPEALANSGDRQALQPGAGTRQEQAAAVSDARGRVAGGLSVRAGAHRPGAAPGGALSGRRGAATPAQRYAARLEFEIKTIIQMGFAGYFLIVADFINWAKSHATFQRRAGRARARLGRRLAGRLCARDHRPRPVALRPAVRALPQSGAGVDARLRHRLLPGRPRPRDRVREAEVRHGLGVADRDLRHHGGEGGGARRRTRDGMELQPHRRAGQADPVSARAS